MNPATDIVLLALIILGPIWLLWILIGSETCGGSSRRTKYRVVHVQSEKLFVPEKWNWWWPVWVHLEETCLEGFATGFPAAETEDAAWGLIDDYVERERIRKLPNRAIRDPRQD